MTLNIQFCGGCNPRYDRGAFAARIRETYPDIECLYNAEVNTDAVLILCGCSTACAAVPEGFGPCGRLTVRGKDMWEDTAAFLERISENDKKVKI